MDKTIILDGFSRFGGIFLTDSENCVSRKAHIKFWEPITLSLKIFTNTSYVPNYKSDQLQIFEEYFKIHICTFDVYEKN